MGNPYLLQGCLRLDTEKIPDLQLGKEYLFEKDEHRLYMINVPIDLWTSNWNFLARVIITQIKIGNNKTVGKFVPVKLFNEDERKIISKIYVTDEQLNTALNYK